MALSFVTNVGDGVTTDFNFPIPYLNKVHVHAFVSNVETTAFTWLNATQIRFTVAPANAAVVKIQRITPTTPLTDYSNGSTLIDADLDRTTIQSLYVAEEATDSVATKLGQDNSGIWDAQSKRIQNVANGTVSTDAVNKGQLDAVSVAAGNVPSPGSGEVGRFLKATATGLWAWVAIAYADISSLLSANASAARTALGLASGATTTVGTAATLNVGTGANNIVQLDGSSKIPAVDGSQITKLADAIGGSLTSEAGIVTTSSAIRIYAPFAMTVTDIFAALNTAQASGAVLTYTVSKNGSTILSSAGTFANAANTSVNAVLSGTPTFAKGDRIDITVTQVGNGTAAGLKVVINGTR